MASEQQLTNRVKTCRIARGWSQDDLAARAGFPRRGQFDRDQSAGAIDFRGPGLGRGSGLPGRRPLSTRFGGGRRGGLGLATAA